MKNKSSLSIVEQLNNIEDTCYSEVVYLCSIINESDSTRKEQFYDTILKLDTKLQEYKAINQIRKNKQKEEKDLKDYYNSYR